MKPRTRTRTYVLAGDIGGTKTNLGLFTMGARRPAAVVLETFSSQSSAGLEPIVEAFRAKHPEPIDGACFGIAGPVVNGRSRVTNLPWELSESGLSRAFGCPVRLINDLAATALAVPLLEGRELCPLNRAAANAAGNIALVAPGTGLGEALLIRSSSGYLPVPSEGGHADFAPNGAEELALYSWLHKRLGHVSAERVLSGQGILNIYAWLKESGRYTEPAWLKAAMGGATPAKAIDEGAMKRRNPLCMATLRHFVSIFGAIAGNLALTGMSTGGVYLGGGIPPRILPVLRQGHFMRAFLNKGRLRPLLQKMPVRVILNDQAALLGAASDALAGATPVPF